MRKIFLLLSISFLITLEGYSQTVSVKGIIAESKTQTPLPNAYVQLMNVSDSTKKIVATNTKGEFFFDNMKRGSYALKVTFIGYQAYEKRVRISNQPLDLATISLLEDSKQLNEVKVVGQLSTGSQKGDTIQFNAGAFKTNPDANAEDLVEKLPGVTVTNGKVQAQGEDVKQVLVDGKPFFGSDPTAALRTLPAEVIDKVQVFDQLSEQSQFTGFDDGNTSKTINIITKPNMRNGQFGKAYAGHGTDHKYQAGASINNFKGTKRLTVLAQSNNINQQNFSSDDLLGVASGGGGGGRGGFQGGGGAGGRGGGAPGGGGGGDAGNFQVNAQNGIATTHAFGLNYSDEWGKKIKISGSYFFNYGNSVSLQNSLRQYVIPSLSGQEYAQDSKANSKNINHRLNLRLEYTIDQNNSILIRPRLSLQKNEGSSNLFGETTLKNTPLNETLNQFNSNLLGYSFSNDILFRHKFTKRGRTISVNVGTSLNDKSGDNLLYAKQSYFTNRPSVSIINQSANLVADGWGLSTNVSYTEPIGKKSIVTLNYDLNYQYNDSDKETFNYVDSEKRYSRLDTALSNVFNSDYLTHKVGAGYRYTYKKIMFMGNVGYQYASLVNQQKFPRAFDYTRSFENLLPNAMLTYRFSNTKNLRLNYRAQTSQPSVSQLQEVLDNSNPLQLSIGNSKLVQSFQHNLSLRYLATNTGSSTNFLAFINADIANNYIGSSTIIAIKETTVNGITLQPGTQLSRQVNLDGRYSLRSFVSYGMPIKFIKTNLNLNLSGGLTRTPSSINDETNYANSKTYGIGVVFSSNISPKVDFTISSNSNLSAVTNSLRKELNTNYYNQTTRFKTNLIFGKGFVFQTELNHQHYAGLSSSYNTDFLLWNISVGKKVFKNQQGDIRLTSFDVLKQNNSIQRNITGSYIEDTQSNVLQRYFMLTFTYTLKNYKGELPQQQQQNGNFPFPQRRFEREN